VRRLRQEDKDGNGLIGRFCHIRIFSFNVTLDYEEWTTYYKKHVRDARNLFPAFQVLLYQPQYSCSPPPVVIVFLSCLQVSFVFYLV
jgi:hypothetical protein